MKTPRTMDCWMKTWQDRKSKRTWQKNVRGQERGITWQPSFPVYLHVNMDEKNDVPHNPQSQEKEQQQLIL